MPRSLKKGPFVDEGTTLKRFQPRAQGRAFRINKRTSHITVVLATPDELTAAARAAPRAVVTRSTRRASPKAARVGRTSRATSSSSVVVVPARTSAKEPD